MGTKKRDERGVYALLTAILAILLMSIAAMAVDIGNAVARKSDVQGQADFGALSGAAKLGTQVSGTVPTAVLDAIRDSMNDNRPVNRNTNCATAVPACVTSSQLVDGNLANGEARFANGGLQVFSPKDRVNYSFAGIMGYNSKDVQGSATVGLYSPGKALPFYVSDACSYLQQTIIDPANGQDTPVAPVLNPASGSDATRLRTITPASTPVNVNPGTITIATQGGQEAKDVVKVAFTSETIGSNPVEHYELTPTNGSPIASGDTITVTLPPAAYDSEILFYVRVKKSDADGWSTSALTFAVGQPPLYCQGTESGNFGALNLSRNDSTHGNWVARNTALGVQHNLGVMSPPATPCASNGGVLAPATPNPNLYGINCLETEPGLVQQATEGFIKGNGGDRGLLDTYGKPERNTKAGCNGGTNRPVTMNHTTYSLNNDVLTCFITGTASVGDVSAKVGAPANVISEAIYNSPRFFFLPVLSNDPSNGRSGTWPIITFRSAFLTGQPSSATVADPKLFETNAAGTDNGLVTDSNDVTKVRVVLINEASMPDTANGTTILSPYRGAGPKIIRMID